MSPPTPLFALSPPLLFRPRRPSLSPPCRPLAPSTPRLRMVSTADNLGLPTALRTYVDALSSVPDPKLRYQQLLFLARQLPPMSLSLKTDATRVRGCTSVVHVHVSLDAHGLVRMQGDSDAQLTKGLLALLVNGLDGVHPDAVDAVDERFIEHSGLAVSLTPSRNNGFVNMLAKIKDSVRRLRDAPDPDPTASEGDVDGRPVYSAILRKLQMLKPTSLDVVDDSAKHAGHAGAEGLDGESHFSVTVVADAFEPLSMVQRHRLIYTLLAEEMGDGGVHALSIDAKTQEEASLS